MVSIFHLHYRNFQKVVLKLDMSNFQIEEEVKIFSMYFVILIIALSITKGRI